MFIYKHKLELSMLSVRSTRSLNKFKLSQASELEGSFTDYDGVFLFRVPDWTHNSEDPITRAPLIREFMYFASKIHESDCVEKQCF